MLLQKLYMSVVGDMNALGFGENISGNYVRRLPTDTGHRT